MPHPSPPHPPVHTVTIFVNNREVAFRGREATGSEIKATAGLPTEFQLFLERGNHLERIQDDQVVELHPHMRFRAISGQDVS